MSTTGQALREGWTPWLFTCRDASWARRLTRASILLTLIAGAQAALALLGAALEVESLRTYSFQWRPMTESAAVSVLLAAIALLCLREPRSARWRLAGYALAASSMLLTAMMVTQDVTSSWLSRGDGPPQPVGWLAPNTAVGSLLLGASLLTLDAKKPAGATASQLLALAAAIVAFLGLLGYLYGVRALYWIGGSAAMSLPSSVAILALSIAIVLARLDRGLGALLASEGAGGRTARRLLPAAVLVPTLLGSSILAVQHMGLDDPALATALVIAATVVLFTGATARDAAALGRVDTERREAVRELERESVSREREQQRLRAVLDVLPVAVVIADREGRVTASSHAARVLWGESLVGADAVLAQGWDARTGARLTPTDWGLGRALERAAPSLDHEVDVLSHGGERRTVLSHAAPIRDLRGGVVGAVAVMVDITERKRAERELAVLKAELERRVELRTAELRAANAELEAFSYSVSHDLRAPLRWIAGFADALAEEHASELGAQGRAYLAQLDDSVQRMRVLIDALLGLSQVTTRPIERAPVDLSAMAHEIAAALEREAPERAVRWTIQDGIVVSADPALVRVALDNLLRNAWKFTRPRETARIELGASDESGERVLFVRDNGVGFEPVYAERLFRAFERLHPHEAFEGTGIGLALVQRIVRRHGGRVWAEGRPDEGATFRFTLAPGGPAPQGPAPQGPAP